MTTAKIPNPHSSRREEALSSPPETKQWRTVKLDEVCEIRLGKMLSPASKLGIRPVPYLRNVNVQWDRFDLSDVAEMDFDEKQELTLSLRPGDLLVCEGGEPGRAAVWEGQIERCCYQKALHRLRPLNEAVDPRFLLYRLWLGGKQNEFIRSNAKTTIAHLPANRLAKLSVMLPEIAEQRRLAARLREQMSEVERARAAVQDQLGAAQSLPAALLRAVFTSPAARRWPRRKLGEVAIVGNGYGFSEHFQGRTDLPFPFIKVSDMNADGAEETVSRAAHTVDNFILKQLGAKTYPAGTVIFPKVGGALLTNKKRVLGVEATFDNNVMGIVPQEAESEWIYRWILTIDLKTLANTQALPSIRQSVIAALEIPMPPKSVREQLFARFDAELTAARTLIEKLEARLAEIEFLPAALLRSAFSPAN